MTFIKEFPRERDVYVLFRGDAYPVSVSQTMVNLGWAGGQGVQWTSSSRDEFLVTFSDGLYGGFLLWGSDESSDKLTSLTGNQPLYGYGILCAGGWLIATSTYEKYTYASRQAGPLVPIVYSFGQRLVFSLRGLFTNEDEWAISADPRGSNGFFIASVVQIPTVDNDFYLTLQTSI